MNKWILEIGNWPPPVCSWSMSLVGLRKELEARGWHWPGHEPQRKSPIAGSGIH